MLFIWSSLVNIFDTVSVLRGQHTANRHITVRNLENRWQTTIYYCQWKIAESKIYPKDRVIILIPCRNLKLSLPLEAKPELLTVFFFFLFLIYFYSTTSALENSAALLTWQFPISRTLIQQLVTCRWRSGSSLRIFVSSWTNCGPQQQKAVCDVTVRLTISIHNHCSSETSEILHVEDNKTACGLGYNSLYPISHCLFANTHRVASLFSALC